MKTQIIQLDAQDDCLSVRDKLGWSQAERIILVWPAHGSVLNRLLDLKLVLRHASRLGAQIALVTEDPIVCFHAHQIGIPQFDDLGEVQREDWKANPVQQPEIKRDKSTVNLDGLRSYVRLNASLRADTPLTRLLSIFISLAAFLAIGAVLLPGATITLTPQREIQSIQLDLLANPSSSAASTSSGMLPTYRQEVIIEGRDTITATGWTLIPDAYAIADLQLTNASTQTVTLPSGTIVASRGNVPVRFIITSSSNVLIGASKTVMVPARAINPGTSGNLPAGSLSVIDDNSGLALEVSNPRATHGGTDGSVPSPNTYDLQTLRQQLESALEQDAFSRMQSYLPVGDLLISPTMTLLETIEETQMPSINQPGDQLVLYMRAKYQCQVISLGMLHDMASNILDEKLPAGYSALPDTLVFASLPETSQGKDGFYHVATTAKRELQADIPVNRAINEVTGLTIAQAKDQLSATFSLAKPVDITLTPSWWPWLPFTALRIRLLIAENP